MNKQFNSSVYPCNAATQSKLPLQTEQRELNLLIAFNDHGPFHHLSQKLEEITLRKKKELHSSQLLSMPSLWEHSSLSRKIHKAANTNTQIWQKLISFYEIITQENILTTVTAG